MTLDEAIQYERDRTKELFTRVRLLEDTKPSEYGTWSESVRTQAIKDCTEETIRHRQLAEWLQELKDRREKDK